LGSSEQSILYSLLFENIILVLIATMLSVPITIYFMTSWLNNYSSKVSISWWIFLVAFTIAVSLVLLTVYFYSYKASRTNPVEALRYE
jgi:putative ABC transport system permease protein